MKTFLSFITGFIGHQDIASIVSAQDFTMSSSDEDSVLSSAAAIMMRHGHKDKWYKRVSHQVKGAFSNKKRAKRFTKSAENLNKINKEVMTKSFLSGSLLSLPGMHKREWSDTESGTDDEDPERDDDSCQGISLAESDKVTEHDSVSQVDIQVTLADESPCPNPLHHQQQQGSSHHLCVPHEDSDASDVSEVEHKSGCLSVCDTSSVDSLLQVMKSFIIQFNIFLFLSMHYFMFHEVQNLFT